jgi:hypothetical protein
MKGYLGAAVIAAMAVAAAGGAWAESVPAQAGSEIKKDVAAKPGSARLDPKARVCKSVTYTGSRLGTTKICKSRAEWEELANAHEDQTNRIQRNTMPHISRD